MEFLLGTQIKPASASGAVCARPARPGGCRPQLLLGDVTRAHPQDVRPLLRVPQDLQRTRVGAHPGIQRTN